MDLQWVIIWSDLHVLTANKQNDHILDLDIISSFGLKLKALISFC